MSSSDERKGEAVAFPSKTSAALTDSTPRAPSLLSRFWWCFLLPTFLFLAALTGAAVIAGNTVLPDSGEPAAGPGIGYFLLGYFSILGIVVFVVAPAVIATFFVSLRRWRKRRTAFCGGCLTVAISATIGTAALYAFLVMTFQP